MVAVEHNSSYFEKRQTVNRSEYSRRAKAGNNEARRQKRWSIESELGNEKTEINR